jgi:DNA-directed RNA polymerase specialized sigma24 family protein
VLASGPTLRGVLITTFDGIFREEWGRVLATLIGVPGDFDLAEDAAQEAFARRTGGRGILSNPRAWLMTMAQNRAKDRLRVPGRCSGSESGSQRDRSDLPPAFRSQVPTVAEGSRLWLPYSSPTDSWSSISPPGAE